MIPRTVELVVGLMSGTSADGVDAVLVRFPGPRRFELVAHCHYGYDGDLRARLLRAADPEAGTVDEICRLNFLLGEVFAEAALAAIAEAGLRPDRVDLIGSHGHTIRHLPGRGSGPGCTLQIGEAAVIAERTGLDVVCDFRPRDMAAGGQGAPLVPYFDYAFFAEPGRTRVLLNIGGIANLTAVNGSCGPEMVVAYDTGPGNMVLDGLVRRYTGGALAYDRDGAIGSAGRINGVLLSWALGHPYFALAPPKTTGREEFGQAYLEAFIDAGQKAGASWPDLIATAAALTAETAGAACRAPAGLPPPDEVIAGGGGAKNPLLLELLRGRLGPGISLRTTDDYGLPAGAKEAVAFAFLAKAAAAGAPNNLPAATGAGREVIMGKFVPGSHLRC